MKTRQEMIYDFMLALAASPNVMKPLEGEYDIAPDYYDAFASDIYRFASDLSDVYLNNGELK